MTHGIRPHMARNVVCPVKVGFTTWEAAYALLTKVPGAERVIRGSCCGMFHITSMTEAEFAQAIAAAQGCTDGFNRGMMDLSTEEYLKRWDQDHGKQADQGREPRTRQGDAGAAAEQRAGSTRLAPSPATVARRLQARSDPGR